MGVKARLQVVLWLIAVCAVSLTAWRMYAMGTDALRTTTFNRLTAVLANRSDALDRHFESLRREAETLGTRAETAVALNAFSLGMQAADEAAGSDSDESDGPTGESLDGFYAKAVTEQFQTRGFTSVPDAVTELPETPGGRLIQSLYVASNPNSFDTRDAFAAAPDGSDWSAAHASWHEAFRRARTRFGYGDILLIDAETQRIVYTTAKRFDLGRSIDDPLLADTNFAGMVRAVLNGEADSEGEPTRFCDYDIWMPAFGDITGFVVTPVRSQDSDVGVEARIIGALAIAVPIDEVNAIMTGNERWESSGLGRTGESYIVGDDRLLRSESRFLLEDLYTYLENILDAGGDQPLVDQMRRSRSAVLLQPVRTDATKNAFAGVSNTQVLDDYRGIPVLSSYAPLNLPDLDWVVIAEIDRAEAFETSTKLRNGTLITGLIVIGLLTIFTFVFPRRILGPLTDVTRHATQIASGSNPAPLDIDGSSEAASISTALDDIQTRITNAEGERDNHQRLLAHAPQAILVVNHPRAAGDDEYSHDIRVQWANNAATLLLGYEFEELTGMMLERVIQQEDDQAFQRWLDEVVTRGQCAAKAETLRGRGEKLIDVISMSSVVPDEQEHPTFIQLSMVPYSTAREAVDGDDAPKSAVKSSANTV